MSDHLSELRSFAAILDTGSIAGAARRLGVSAAVVSRRLARLERRLGTRLIQRTTRSLTPTDAGAAFHVRCARILAELTDAEDEAASGSRTVAGTLRVTSTVAFARRLAPLLKEFQNEHPALHVQLHASDAVMPLVEGGFDLAVRFGALSDSSLIARPLAANRRVICATPEYLARRGWPRSPADLSAHDCVRMGDPPQSHWRFADGTSIPVSGPLASSDGDIAHQWALQGAGLVLKSIWDVHEDVAAGRLEVVLPEHPLPASPVHAVYPHRRFSPAKLRLCIAHIGDALIRRATVMGLPAAAR